MKRRIQSVICLLLLLLSVPAHAGFECEFYPGCRPVWYAGYGYVCTCDSLSQTCTECCDVEAGICCVNGYCH